MRVSFGLFSLLAVLCTVASSKSLAGSQEQICSFTEEAPCGKDNADVCTSLKKVPCHHGQCGAKGCQCLPCWKGKSCDTLDNKNSPHFVKKVYEALVDFHVKEVQTIAILTAQDPDSEECKTDDDCPCAEIAYAITSGNDQAAFKINTKTGVIKFYPENALEGPVTLVVTASNPHSSEDGQDRNGKAEVVIHQRSWSEKMLEAPRNVANFQSQSDAAGRRLMEASDPAFNGYWGDSDSNAHHIERRSTGAIPDNNTIVMMKSGDSASVTEVKIGDTINLNISIGLPAIVQPFTLEIFTPEGQDPVMSICNPTITSVGSNLNVSATDVDFISSTYKPGNLWVNSYTLDFGYVHNSGADTSNDAANKITLDFSVLIVNTTALKNGTRYWVSAASRYLGYSRIWVAQVSVLGVKDSVASGNPPTFNLEGPSTLDMGATGTWKINVTSTDGANKMVVDVFAHNSSDVISICRVNVGDLGAGYGCYPKDNANQTFGNGMVTFDLKEIVNTEYRTSSDNASNIVIEISALMKNTSDVIVGQRYTLGATITVDGSHMWAVIKYITATSNDTYKLTSPVSFLVSTSRDTLTVGEQTAFVLNMTIPADTTSKYVLEMALPFNSSAVMTPCRVQIIHVGFNFPCFSANNTPTYSSEDNSATHDFVRYDLGMITNTGQRSRPEDNLISIQFTARLLPNPLVVPGATFIANLGVRHSDNLIWVSQRTITVAGSLNETGWEPQVSIIHLLQGNYIFERGSTGFFVDIFLPAKSTFLDLNLTFTLPQLNEEPLMKLCRFQLKSIGRNLGCLNSSSITVKLNSRDSSSVMDEATVNIAGYVTNHAIQDKRWLRNDSVIRFEAAVELLEHHLRTDSTVFPLTAKVEHSTNKQVANTLTMRYYPKLAELPKNDTVGYPSLEKVSSAASYKVGGAAAFKIKLVVPPDTINGFKVEALAENTSALSICRIDVISMGDNFPCLSTQNRRNMTYLPVTNSSTENEYRVISLHMGSVANIDQDPLNDTNRAANTMEFGIYVAVRQGGSYDPSVNYTFASAISFGKQKLWISRTELAIDGANALTANPSPTYRIFKRNSISEITIGGAAAFVVEITVPKESLATYTLTATIQSAQSSAGLQICSFRVVKTGRNVPCVNDLTMGHSLNKTANSNVIDKAVIELGSVTAIEADTVEAEVVLCIAANGTINAGTSCRVDVAAEVGGSQSWTGNVEAPATASHNQLEAKTNVHMAIVPREGDIFINVGEIYTMSANLTMGEGISNVTLQLKTGALSGEAYLTLSNVRIGRAGGSIACGQSLVIKTATETEGTTSQVIVLTAHLGLITNTGLYDRYQFRPSTRDDNTIEVLFDVRVADFNGNLNGTIRTVSAEITQTSGNVYRDSRNITVIRNGTETPSLQAFVDTMDHNPLTTNPGDTLTLYMRLNHTKESRCRATQVTAYLYLPSYMTYQAVAGWTGIQPQSSTPVENNRNIEVQYANLRFTDNVTFSVNVTIDHLAAGMGTIESPTYASAITKCKDVVADTVPDTLYETTVASHLAKFFVPECNGTLGMEDGSIQDCQITASSYASGKEAIKARLNSASSWTSAPRGSPFRGKEYLQINLGNRTRVTGFTVQADASTATHYVSTFKVQYSDTKLIWRDYVGNTSIGTTVFSVAFAGGSSEVYIPIDGSPLIARFFRLVALSANTANVFAMRLELHGCTVSSDYAFVDICTEEPDLNPYLYYQRGYLLNPNNGRVFVCMIKDIDGVAWCSYTSDCGTTWEIMDESVANVHFLKSRTNQLYGLANDKKTRMRSDDGGVTWFSIPAVEYGQALTDYSLTHNYTALGFESNINSEIQCNANDKMVAAVQGVYSFDTPNSQWKRVADWGDGDWKADPDTP